jgi:hypothetical protein
MEGAMLLESEETAGEDNKGAGNVAVAVKWSEGDLRRYTVASGGGDRSQRWQKAAELFSCC